MVVIVLSWPGEHLATVRVLTDGGYCEWPETQIANAFAASSRAWAVIDAGGELDSLAAELGPPESCGEGFGPLEVRQVPHYFGL